MDYEGIRGYDPTSYRQGRWHLPGDAEKRTLCGRTIAARRVQKRAGLAEYEVCSSCRTKAAGGSGGSPKMATADIKALLARAAQAAVAAHHAAQPEPMIVGTPTNMLASMAGGDGGEFRTDRPIYHVAEGPCGFAYVYIRPANSRLANYMRKHGMGRTSEYEGGFMVRLWEVCRNDDLRYCQSLARNTASARAFTEVLREAGINATYQTRVD